MQRNLKEVKYSIWPAAYDRTILRNPFKAHLVRTSEDCPNRASDS
jgi:hypothetical protein